MSFPRKARRGLLLVGAAAFALAASVAVAAERKYDIPPQSLRSALREFGFQSGAPILFSPDLVRNLASSGVVGRFEPPVALAGLLRGARLGFVYAEQGYIIVPQSAPAPAAASPSVARAPLAGPSPEMIAGVVVTASRITSAGFSAPTPMTILGPDLLERSSAPNVFQTVAQLPSLMGSTGTGVANGATSTGANGLSAFSIRGLGTIRSLTLVDGQRIVPAYLTGIADVSLMPQLLIQRIDVVTGGASASYGSDAVGGVVNIVTDKRFQGFKANLQGGMTNYGDDRSALAQAAAGADFAGGRGHVTLSGEYFRNGGVSARELGDNGGPNGRTWFKTPGIQQLTIAQTPPGAPQYTFILDAQNLQYSAYGLITAGPLQGTAFGPGGRPYAFQYGSGGVPNRTGAGGAAGCVGPLCQGGDQSGNVTVTSSLDGRIERRIGYARASYDLTPALRLFGTASMAQVVAHNQPNAGAAKPASLTIQCSNAFLPVEVVQACAQQQISSFQFGVANAVFPANIDVRSRRRQQRYVGGVNADFGLFGRNWLFQSYAEHGETYSKIDISNITLTPRYNAAIDAVAGPNGTAVCRSAAARESGCVALNVIGLNPVDPAAWRYVAPAAGPRARTFERQEAVSLAVNGTPFELWAGPVSAAFGGEWREEAYKTRGDPYGAGAPEPFGGAYPADPLLNAVQGNNWYAGNFHDGRGRYSVKEAFIELGAPLFDRSPLGRAEVNLAGRATDYSTSGWVDTWKAGLVWDLPVEGLRVRAVRSRDVRAPNLSELFAGPATQNTTTTDRRTGFLTPIVQRIVGNPDLKPETSANFEVGVVLRPPGLAGFSASLDYYNVKVVRAIASLTNQQTVDLCFNGNKAFCADVFLDGDPSGPNSYVIIRPFNLASISTRGLDMEASYRFGLERWGVPGDFAVRALATHVISFLTNPGVPGQPSLQSAGDNFGANATNASVTPKWKVYAVETWSRGKLALNAAERFVSRGMLNANYIECQAPNCPAPTLEHPTINYNRIPAALYLDVGAAYELRTGVELFFKVDNLFDHDPPPNGNNGVYDFLGRVYRIGARIRR